MPHKRYTKSNRPSLYKASGATGKDPVEDVFRFAGAAALTFVTFPLVGAIALFDDLFGAGDNQALWAAEETVAKIGGSLGALAPGALAGALADKAFDSKS